MKFFTILLTIVVFVVGCATTPTPAPTIVPTAIPTPIPQPTAALTNTALPPTPTQAPTITLPPPTNTPIPSTPTITPTRTLAPITRQATVAATATVTPTVAALKFPAPVLVEPAAGDSLTAGKDDMIFRWAPVGPLGANECYLVTVRITNLTDNEYGEQSFIASPSCNDAGQTDPLSFTISRRAPAPDYAGLLAIASAKTASGAFRVKWNVTVIQNNGADPNKPDPAQYIPLSPSSAPLEFELRG